MQAQIAQIRQQLSAIEAEINGMIAQVGAQPHA
jgi:hypothetical protein